ncbi:MAG TPA: hypothetical protein PLS00_07595 [Niabella sp.]|nr:hypothetical protein [Niabella sp.]
MKCFLGLSSDYTLSTQLRTQLRTQLTFLCFSGFWAGVAPLGVKVGLFGRFWGSCNGLQAATHGVLGVLAGWYGSSG